MRKKIYIILSFFVFVFVTAQQNAVSKKSTISSRINRGEPMPRLLPSEIKEYNLNFKGFGVEIYDEATDELGNHMLIGNITIQQEQENQREAKINEALELFGYQNKSSTYSNNEVLISTDQNYNPIKISKTFQSEVIIYDNITKKFIIGGNFIDYKDIDGKFFSEWQPTLTIVDINHYGKSFLISKDYRCFLKDIVLDKQILYLFTESTARSSENKNGKLELITIDPTLFHKDKAKPWINYLDPIASLLSIYDDDGDLNVSEISKVNNTYYFSTSNQDYNKQNSKNRIYKFEKNELIEQEDYKNAYLLHKDEKWLFIKNFKVKSENEYLFLQNIAIRDEITVAKTNRFFQVKKMKTIKVLGYLSWENLIELPNGNSVIFSIGKDKLWSYFIYNSDFELIKEISSSLNENYYPTKMKIRNNNSIQCFFYDHKKLNNNAILQIIDIK
jgi:hypothetical protein